MRKIYLLIFAGILFCAKTFAQTQTFTYTGSSQTWIVPAGVSSISIKVWGAGGAGSSTGGSGGSGAFIKGTLSVTAGQSLVVVVGGGGTHSATAVSSGGFGSGGASGGAHGASGGGYSGIFLTSISQGTALALSGGGAGGGYYGVGTYGGAGGATTGTAGGNQAATWTGGSGGSTTVGGAGGAVANGNGTAGTSGTALSGGNGGTNTYGGGGGGGGYFGGGGGYGSSVTTRYSTGGGGGASFLGTMTSTTNTAGTTNTSGNANQAPGNAEAEYVTGVGNGGTTSGTSGGNGLVIITYTVVSGPPTITSLGASSGCVGTTLTITGTNFTGATAVKIGGVAVASFVVNSATQITATIASGNTGTVSVTTPGGSATSVSSYTANDPGTITGGSATICTGGISAAFADATGGGTWSITNGTGSATINSSGVATGVTAGTVTVNYTVGTCVATKAMTVTTVPTITTNPANKTVVGGANTTFTTVASNTPTSYTWEVNDGSGWATISDGGVYSTSATATLTITGATYSMNGYLFRVTATNSCGSSSVSGSATLTVTYCGAPLTTNVNTVDIITKIILTNSLAATYTNSSTSNGSTNYDIYNNTPLDLYRGATTNTLAITFGTDATQYSAAWIDFNRNGVYESGESIGIAAVAAGGSSTVTYTFTVPAGASLGNTRMRVRGGSDAAYSTGGACSTTSYGETEDYLVNITTATVCSAPSSPGTLSLTPTSGSATQIDGSFIASSPAPTGYVIVRYPAGSAVTAPVTGTTYSGGGSLGLGTIVQVSAATTFSATGLTGGTAYDFYVYAYNNTSCSGGPVYSGSSTATASTNLGPVISNVTVPTASCNAAASHVINADITTASGTITSVTLNYNNGSAGSVTMTLVSGNTYTGTIPAASPATTTVTWSITAQNSSSISTVYSGTSYADGTAIGEGVTATASATQVCSGASFNLFAATTGTQNYSEGFEGSFAPTGWTLINAGSGNQWTQSSLNYRSGSYSMEYDYNFSSAANAWAITGPRILYAGTTYTLSFWEAVDNLYTEKLKVTVGNAATVAGQTTVLNTYTLTNGSYVQKTVTYTPATTGTYYFGFNCFSAANQDVLSIDDISLTGTPVFTYAWSSTPSGFTSTSQNPTNVSETVATSYHVIATDANGCAVSSSPDVTVGIAPVLGGVYSVGSTNVSGEAGHYSTLTAAVADYNASCGLSGPVTFALTNSSYTSATETFPITINSNTAASSTNTLTIKPAAGVSTSISGSSASSLISLDAAKYIIIDGSNITNGTSKDLTISNTNTSGSTIMFVDGAVNNTIKNNNVLGVTTAATNGVISFSTGGAAAGNNNNTIQNNLITKGGSLPVTTIYNLGSASFPNTGNLVTTNNIADFSGAGIFDGGNSSGFTYSKNLIYGTATQTSTTTLYGIYLGATTIASPTITGNFIYDLKTTNTTNTGYLAGITVYEIASGTTCTISNNMIALYGNGANAPKIRISGIEDESTAGTVNVYYNSVSITGTASGANTTSFGFLKNFTDVSVLKNNIFSNTRVTSGSVGQYAIANATGSGTMTSNYNDLYSSGNTHNVLGLYNAVDKTTIAAWRTSSGGDANSQSVVATFTSPTTDLHLVTDANCALDGAGVAIGSITTDFDGDSRGTPPDIGADEFTGNFLLTITDPAAVCSPTAVDITVAAITSGSSSSSTFSYYTNSGGTIVLSSPNAVTTSGTYYIKSVKGSCSSIKPVVVTVSPIPTATTTGSGTVCPGSSYTLTAGQAVSNSSLSWAITTGNGSLTNSNTLTPTYQSVAADAGTDVVLTMTASNSPCTNKTATFTIHVDLYANAGAITGASTLCSNSGTSQYSNTTSVLGGSGGTISWSSSNTSIADINGSGLVTVHTAGSITITYTINGGCGSPVSTTFPVTIYQASTAPTGANADALVVCSAGTANLTQTGGVLGDGAQFQWFTDAAHTNAVGAPFTNPNGVTTVVVAGTTTYYVGIVGGTAPCAAPSGGASVTITQGSSWTGLVSSDWFNPLNWCSLVVPGSGTDVTILPLCLHFPVISGADLFLGNAKAHNIIIGPAASLTVNGTGILSLYGTVTNTGSGNIDATSGTINLASSSAVISGSNLKNKSLANLSVGADSGGGLSANVGSAANDTLKVTGFVSFGTGGNTLHTNDNLTLVSDANSTASVKDITNNGAFTNTITGMANVERYIPATRKWRFLAVNTTGGNTTDFTNSWMEGQTPGTATATGYGLWITDPAGTGNGFDAASPGATIKWWNTATSAYVSIGNTNFNMLDPLAHGAFMTFVRGDRSATGSGAGASVSTSTVLRTKGNLVQGTPSPISIPPAPVGVVNYTAVGNPFASAIDLSKLLYSNTTQVINIAIWDPNGTGPTSLYGLGAFKYLYKDPVASGGDGNFHMTFGGGSYPDVVVLIADIMNTIESGQAFFISGNGTTQTVQFNEPAKTPKAHDVFFAPGQQQVLSGLFLIKDAAGTPTVLDGVRVKFDAAYTNAVNDNDALKLGNTSENISVKYDNKLLAIYNRALPDENDTVQLNIANLRIANYQWKFNLSNMDQPDRAAFLIDRYLNTETPLSLTGATTYDFPVVNIAGSYAANRFLVVFRQALAGPLPVTLTSISATRLADKTVIVKWHTENEIAINHYELQRSGNGTQFISIASDQSPTNNAGGSAAYSKNDMAPLSGDNYYRIKAISNNGHVQYSAIVKVDPIVKDASISIYPNPISDRVMNLKFAGETPGKYELQLSDKAGRTVYTASVTITDGNEVKSLNIGDGLRSGGYDLVILGPDGKKRVIQVVLE